MKNMTVIGSAAFTGVMLTIGAGLVPFFFLAGPAAFERWFADYFVFLLSGVFLTSVPAFIGSIAMIRRTPKKSAERSPWVKTLVALAFVYGITMVVHLPLNILFWSMELSDSQINSNLWFWTAAHVLRIAGALYASITALRAVDK